MESVSLRKQGSNPVPRNQRDEFQDGETRILMKGLIRGGQVKSKDSSVRESQGSRAEGYSGGRYELKVQSIELEVRKSNLPLHTHSRIDAMLGC